MNNTSVLTNEDPYPFEDFAPTLAQCFIIVFAGYFAAKYELLSATDLRGVSAFAKYFSMPGIICISLATADFEDLRWELLVGLFLGKAFIFILVATISYLISGNIGVAGLLATFCAHTNDLPVGNPLMSALYRDYRPHMMKYLFLMPAMTMLFFVPIGSCFIRMHRSKQSENKGQTEDASSDQCEKLWKGYAFKRDCMMILRSSILNPVIFATFLGIVLNLSFKSNIPGVIHQPINVVAATIPGLALSILGFNMVRKERYLIRSAIVPAVVLLMVKIVLTPLILHTFVRCLSAETQSFKLLSDFALLYGIISPATVVFQSGQEFRKPLAAMSAALILTSFICFPVSYIAARLTIVPTCEFSYYTPMLKNILFWIAILNISCNIFTWISILCKKQLRHTSYCYASCFVFTQLSVSCGILIWNFSNEQFWFLCLQMAFYYGGEISGYFLTGIVALILILDKRNPRLAEKGHRIVFFACCGLSVLITVAVCLLIANSNDQKVYFVGRVTSRIEFLQVIATSVVLGVNTVIIGFCLIFYFKKHNQASVPCEEPKPSGYENELFYIEDRKETEGYEQKQPSSMDTQHKLNDKEEELFYCEDTERAQTDKVSKYGQEWAWRSFSLVLLLWLIMVVKLISNILKLTQNDALEIMIPLEFLQSSLFVGQGVPTLLTFGVDVRTASIMVIKWWRKVKNGNKKFVSEISNLEDKNKIDLLARQFRSFYYASCFRDLAKDKRWKGNIYKNSFWGHQLVDWLIEQGLCKDDTEGEEYGQKLLLGGVFRHVKSERHFYDAPYLYYFSNFRDDSYV